MATKTIAGPFADKQAAEETARAIGANCSVYGVERKDSEGYGTDVYDYFVEQDDAVFSGKLFGYEAAELMARQYK